MFLNNLDMQQQAAFLETAKLLIEADTIISNSETELLKSLKLQCDEALTPIDNFEVSSLNRILNTNKEKVSFLLELIAVAFIDGDYHEREESFIDEVARIIGISSKKLGALESWVIRQTALSTEALTFME